MNNKNIRFFLLFLSVLLPLKVFGSTNCDNSSLDKTCVEVFVESHTGKALKDLVVYLEPIDGQVLDKQENPLVIKQAGKSFAPYISVSQISSNVNFVNQDDITHHIYSVGSENKFSFKIKAGDTNTSVKLDHPAEVAMGCNIHDWMSGYILVVNTPYYAKTDVQGIARFEISTFGKYRIVVWHPQMQNKDKRMMREENISPNSRFTFKLVSEMVEIPLQKSDDDFDFLSDYE